MYAPGERWAMDKAKALLAAAERNPFRKAPFQRPSD